MKIYLNKKQLLLKIIFFITLFLFLVFSFPLKNHPNNPPNMNTVERQPTVIKPTLPPEVFPIHLDQPAGNLKIPLYLLYTTASIKSKIQLTRIML